MPICLYGLIAPADAPMLPVLQGIDGTPVRVVDAGPLAALVSDLLRAPDRNRLDDVRAHDAVLGAAVAAGITTAASRFGQAFRSDDDVRAAVAESGGGARVVTLLREQRGCVEMRLLLPPSVARRLQPDARAPEPAPDAPDAPGTAYLERARARLRRPGIGVQRLLGDVVRAERAEELPGGRGAVLAHLVERGRLEEYHQAVSATSVLSGARVVGPLAFHSFAGPLDD